MLHSQQFSPLRSPSAFKHAPVGCLLVPPAPVVTATDWTSRLSRLCILSLLFWKPFCFGWRYVRATLNFGKTSDQLLGVDLNFQLRLPVSLEHGWSWDTRTIKTHVPTYKESLADHTFLVRLSPHSLNWDSLDFVQVQLKLRTQGFLSSELLRESCLWSCIGQLRTLFATICIQSTFVYVSYFCLNWINSWHYYYRQQIEVQTCSVTKDVADAKSNSALALVVELSEAISPTWHVVNKTWWWWPLDCDMCDGTLPGVPVNEDEDAVVCFRHFWSEGHSFRKWLGLRQFRRNPLFQHR